MYNFVDLFAGCGGLSEGFLSEKSFNGIAHVEWELPMVNTLRNRLVKKWGHSIEESQKSVIHFDIQKTDELTNGNWSAESNKVFSSTNHPDIVSNGINGLLNKREVDIIIGGPPCQAYSIHGRAQDKNSMKDDYRNYLFESFVRLVDIYKPKIFVFENVPGILSAKPGGVNITERIFEAFDKVNYKILKPEFLSEAVFDVSNYGVAQTRKRVIIIGIPKDSNYELNEIYSLIRKRGKTTNKKTVWDAIADLPKIYPHTTTQKIDGKNVSHYNETTSAIAQHTPRYHNSRDVEIFREWVSNRMNYVSQKDKIEYYYNKTGKNTLYCKYKNLEWDKQSHTLVAHLEKDGLMFIHPDADQARSITIREAARLMSFPDDYEFIGSNAKCYKMIGNAVPVKFSQVLAESIVEFLTKK